MNLANPVLIVNLKRYDEALGRRSMRFAEAARKLSEKHNVTILIAPPGSMIGETSKIALTISQHFEPLEPGAHTGSFIAKEVKDLGAIGSLINHSEKRMTAENVGKCVDFCRKYGLASIVCVQDCKEAELMAGFKPDFIAIEPPELIGGNVSVSTAKPEIVKHSVECVERVSPSTRVLCGAGIKNKEDVRKALELGAEGVLVASGVVKAPDIEKAMEELIEGME